MIRRVRIPQSGVWLLTGRVRRPDLRLLPLEDPPDPESIRRVQEALDRVKEKYGMTVPDSQVQRVEVAVVGPRIEPRSPVGVFGATPQPRQVHAFSVEVPNMGPEQLRARVVDFVGRLCDEDTYEMEHAESVTRVMDETEAVDKARSILEQEGWTPPTEQPRADHWSQRLVRTEDERDPKRHMFDGLTTPGLTTRCGICGRAARAHTDVEAEEEAAVDHDPQV